MIKERGERIRAKAESMLGFTEEEIHLLFSDQQPEEESNNDE